MTAIQTVTGPVEHTALGVTLAHEHLVLASPGLPQQYPWLYDRESLVEHAAAELVEARNAGVATVVDVSPPDLGRDVRLLEAIAQASGVNVVACTGIWIDIPRWFTDASVDEIADVFAHEIEVGIADTTIRAGIIKVANNRAPGIGPVQDKVLRGAAQAAMRTGVPITTHTNPYDVGRDQMRVFEDAGLSPHLLAIGHSYTSDLAYLREVVEGGHYLSIDNFKPGKDGEDGVLEAIATLCAEGHAGHIMLSHDHVPEWDWRPHPLHPGPSIFTYVPTDVRRKLAGLGVSERDVEAMLVDAPAAFLSGERGAKAANRSVLRYHRATSR
jgi:phosphotriesterase-related protein